MRTSMDHSSYPQSGVPSTDAPGMEGHCNVDADMLQAGPRRLRVLHRHRSTNVDAT
jgi:hypothetical protein